jgi:xanthine permease XanP
MTEHTHVRYEPEDRPPHILAAGMGAQIVAMILTGIMLTPLIVSRTANLDAGAAAWLIFAALIAAGLSTWLQIVRIGRIGSGYVTFVGSNPAFIAVAVMALEQGGPALLATLTMLAAFSSFLFTWQMPAMRRILTPAVGGIVLILMAMSVAPVVWKMMTRVPAGFEVDAPLIVAVTVTLIFVVSIFSEGVLRLWAPLIGVVGGSLFAFALGVVDLAPVQSAAWIGLPSGSWPGFDFSFSASFWGLLPAFVMLSLVACIERTAFPCSATRAAPRPRSTSRPCRARSTPTASAASSPARSAPCRTRSTRSASPSWS